MCNDWRRHFLDCLQWQEDRLRWQDAQLHMVAAFVLALSSRRLSRKLTRLTICGATFCLTFVVGTSQVGLNLRKCATAQVEKGTARFRDIWEVRGCGSSHVLEQRLLLASHCRSTCSMLAPDQLAHHHGCASCHR
jgi:hypothetical protein